MLYMKNKVVELILKWVANRKALPDYNTRGKHLEVTIKPAFLCEMLMDVQKCIGTDTIIDIFNTRVTIIPYDGKEWTLTFLFPHENVTFENYSDTELFPSYHYDIDDFIWKD